MSANFPGVTFAEQRCTPADDALLNSAMLSDGILSGCTLSYSGSTLTMGTGALLICGRQVRHPASQSWNLTGAASGFARIVLTVDLARAATETVFDQVNDSVEYAPSVNGFSTLTQADINVGGTVYQFELCVVSLGYGGITGIYRQARRHTPGSAYAPADFGLGLISGAELRSLEELDAVIRSGWYHLSITSGENMVHGVNVSRATVLVSMYDERYGFMDINVANSPVCFRRFRLQGMWGAWLFMNPALTPGDEYPTIENWNGSTVYAKLLAFSASDFTDQRIALPHGIEGMDICISSSAIWKRTDTAKDGWRQLPQAYYDTSAWSGQINYVGPQNVEFALGYKLLASLRASTEPVYVTLKYTKQ